MITLPLSFLCQKTILKIPQEVWDFLQQQFSYYVPHFLSIQQRKSHIPADIRASAIIISVSLNDKKHKQINAAPNNIAAALDLLRQRFCLMPFTTFNTFYSCGEKSVTKHKKLFRSVSNIRRFLPRTSKKQQSFSLLLQRRNCRM